MLTKLLSLLNEGRAYSQQEISGLLHVSQGSIIAQLEFLETQGMLRRVSTACGCSGGCNGCGSGCDAKAPTMWELVG